MRESLHPVGARVLGSTSHAPRDDRFSLPSRVHNQQTNSDALSRDASILSNSAASIGQQGNNTLYTDLGLLLLILLFGGSSKLRSKPFTPWLWGSNQIEHMFSEWRSFEHGKHDVELLLSTSRQALRPFARATALSSSLQPLV